MTGTNQRRRRGAKEAGRAAAVGVSLAAHGGLVAALLLTWVSASPPPELKPIVVSLIAAPIPAPTPATTAPKSTPKPVARHDSAPPKPMQALRTTPVSRQPPSHGSTMGLSDAQLAGAASADSESGGGICDMARRVQAALRKDPLAQAAVTQTGSRAIIVWNGDWVQSPSEDGKGLAALREAVMWEVAFAPAACRAQSVHGLVLLSLNTGSKVALGSAQWRWSDLLATREASVR